MSPDQVAPGPTERIPLPPHPSADEALLRRRALLLAHDEPTASTTTTGCTAAATPDAAELLQGVREGDPQAWEDILRCYSSTILARVRSFRLQDADARDAVQMTWLRLAENSHQIRHPEYLGGWLATTAARECLRILRRARHTAEPVDALAENVADPAAGPEQRIVDAETAHTLQRLVAKLPPRRRMLLRALFADRPPPYAELSRALGIPIGSIGPTRDRALRQLQQMLEDHHLTLGA